MFVGLIIQGASAFAAIAATCFWYLSARALPPAKAKIFWGAGVGYSPEYVEAVVQRAKCNTAAALLSGVSAILQAAAIIIH